MAAAGDGGLLMAGAELAASVPGRRSFPLHRLEQNYHCGAGGGAVGGEIHPIIILSHCTAPGASSAPLQLSHYRITRRKIIHLSPPHPPSRPSSSDPALNLYERKLFHRSAAQLRNEHDPCVLPSATESI